METARRAGVLPITWRCCSARGLPRQIRFADGHASHRVPRPLYSLSWLQPEFRPRLRFVCLAHGPASNLRLRHGHPPAKAAGGSCPRRDDGTAPRMPSGHGADSVAIRFRWSTNAACDPVLSPCGSTATRYGISDDPSRRRERAADRGFTRDRPCTGRRRDGAGWYDNGKQRHKPNTFSDFIACAEHLIAGQYTSPRHLTIEGAAGGLLVGAVLNQRPELFFAAGPTCRSSTISTPYSIPACR